MAGKIASFSVFSNRSFNNGETFVSEPIDLTNAEGYFSYHCIVNGSVTLTAEVSVDNSHWIPLSDFSKDLSDTQIAEAIDVPVSCFLRFKVTASSNGSITLMFAYI